MEVLVFRNGSWSKLIPGSVIMLTGIIWMWAFTFGIGRPFAIGGYTVVGLLILLGFGIFTFGARFAFFRTSVTINCQHRSIEYTRAFIVPLKTTRYEFGDVPTVTAMSRIQGTPFGPSAIKWAVELKGPAVSIEVEAHDREDAIDKMDQISKCMGKR